MKYVCDAPGKMTWFRLETMAEVEQEAALMQHAVEKHFRREREKAADSFAPSSSRFIEQNIGLEAHIQRRMPLFLTLRDSEGNAHVTAMLPPQGRDSDSFRKIIVGNANSDPYPQYEQAIGALGQHFDLMLDRASCYPYGR